MKCKICDCVLEKDLIINNPQKPNEHYTYKVCSNCMSGELVEGFNSKDSLHYDSEYHEYYSNKKGSLSKLLDFLYGNRIDYVLKFLDLKSKNILDIGCGTGDFLIEASMLNANIFGTELNKSALIQASNEIPKSHLFESDFLNDAVSISEKFDLITAWHVLEHIRDPKLFVKRLEMFFKKEGIVVIEVPNINSLNLKIFKSHYKWISLPEHKFFYSEKGLRYLFNNKRYRVLNVYYPFMFPLMFSNHLDNMFLRLVSIPISIVIYFLAPLFKMGESVRVVLKYES